MGVNRGILLRSKEQAVGEVVVGTSHGIQNDCGLTTHNSEKYSGNESD